MTDEKPVLFQFINPCRFVVTLYSASSSKQSQPVWIWKVNSFLLVTEFQKGGRETCNKVPQCGSKTRLVILIKHETNPAEFSFPYATVYIKDTIIKQVYSFAMSH